MRLLSYVVPVAEPQAGELVAHDVIYHIGGSLEAVLQLLSEPDEWLKNQVPPERQGTKSLYETVFLFRQNPYVGSDRYLVEGMPAAKVLNVSYSSTDEFEKEWGEKLEKEIGSWFESAPIVVTIHRKDRRAFVHVEVTKDYDVGRLFFGLILDPTAFPRLLPKREIKLRVFNDEGDETASEHEVDAQSIQFVLDRNPTLSYVLGGPGCTSCTFSIGYVNADEWPFDQEGKPTEKIKVGLNGFSVARWCP